jgi:hypothetical protein
MSRYNIMTEISETGLISIITIISGICALALRMCLKSKCDQVDCLCLKIHRAVDLESQEQQQQQEPRLDEVYSDKINI